MKTYSDLQDTKIRLDVELELVGSPDFLLTVKSGGSTTSGRQELKQFYELDLLTPFSIIIEIHNKVYTTEYETAVVVRRLSVDNILIIPEYTHCAIYDNDHNYTDPTNYLGFNGKWALTFDRPFYQWLHQAKSQGWLIG